MNRMPDDSRRGFGGGCEKNRAIAGKQGSYVGCGCASPCCTPSSAARRVNESLTTLRKDIRLRPRDDSGRGWQGRRVMALKVELKPHERIIIGACVITNTDQRTKLLI